MGALSGAAAAQAVAGDPRVPTDRPAVPTAVGEARTADAVAVGLSAGVVSEAGDGAAARSPGRRRTVVINQPSLFPWSGELFKLGQVDVSICLDHVAYQPRGYLARTRIAGAFGAPQWLTVPTVTATRTSIADVEVHPRPAWLPHVMNVLRDRYRTTPYLSDVLDLVSTALGTSSVHAVDLAEASLRATADYLGLTLPARHRSSAMRARGAKSALMLGLAQEVRATRYLYGPGKHPDREHYLDIELLAAAGVTAVQVRYPDAGLPDGRPQRLSLLDAIARLGPAARSTVSPAVPVPGGASGGSRGAS